MGMFSWCTSDTRKSIPAVYDSYHGAPETVYLLNPFGDPYKESDYEGYGRFGGRDVYELIAEWNRPFLSEANLRKPERSRYANDKEGSRSYHRAKEHYKLKCEGIKAFASGATDEYMQAIYGKVFGYGDGSDWKRCLGIDIGCYDEEQVRLRYPIKIVEQPCDYEDAGISPSCPFQGFDYGDTLPSIRQTVNREFSELEMAASKYADEKADALDTAFAFMKMEDVYVAETYPHLVVLDDEGHRWVDGEVYDFVLNECLAFEADGTLQFGFGSISQALADTLQAHGKSYGVLPSAVKERSKLDLDDRIAAADQKRSDTLENGQPQKPIERD